MGCRGSSSAPHPASAWLALLLYATRWTWQWDGLGDRYEEGERKAHSNSSTLQGAPHVRRQRFSSAVPRPAASVSSGKLLEMQILGSHRRPTTSEPLTEGASIWVLTRSFGCAWKFENTAWRRPGEVSICSYPVVPPIGQALPMLGVNINTGEFPFFFCIETTLTNPNPKATFLWPFTLCKH